MVYLQLNLPEDLNEQLKILKIKRKDTTIQDTTIFLLQKYVSMEDKDGCN